MSVPLNPDGIPPTSGRNAPGFASSAARTRAGATFDAELLTSELGAHGYHQVRPGYSPAVIERLRALAPDAAVIADIGAGTGKLTAMLSDAYPAATVIGIDPSAPMRQALALTCPTVQVRAATAEDTGLAAGSVDVAAVAQTWHWVDVEAASAELARILTPGAVALLVWNNLDVSIPWVHRLSRIMHAGDVLKPGFFPEVAAPLSLIEESRTTFEQNLLAEEIIALARTRSYWLGSSPRTRERVEDNLRWYLYEHLGFSATESVALPYRCDAFYYRGAAAGRD